MPGTPVFGKMVDWLEKAGEDRRLTAHDVVVGTEIARIVSGGEVDPGTGWSEQDLLNAERKAFNTLVQTNGTRWRIDHMLVFGKPLRN